MEIWLRAAMLTLLIIIPQVATAQSCPANAELSYVTETATTRTHACKCKEGFEKSGVVCVASKPPVDVAQVVTQRFVDRMTALAHQKGWSVEKQTRLKTALLDLKPDGDLNVDQRQVDAAWGAIWARGDDVSLARLAANGKGRGFPGAGLQTRYNDCAIFALANAAGRPYSFISALATEMLKDGDWRSNISEHRNAKRTIETMGLNGGEVIWLTESLGRAEVVPSSQFQAIINGNANIMINVAPFGGVLGQSGHQVVLTKVFSHKNTIWFEMMDSYQGPQRRLFLTWQELSVILQENGIVYRVDK